jgi:hypothetical protein
MKRILILTFAVMMMFALPLGALAAEDTTQVEGEVTQETSVKTDPDSFLYQIKRLYEQFRLITTFDKESKLDLHLELAEQRLQELSTLDAEVKEQFSTELYAEFLANIEEAILLTVQLKEQQKEMDDTLKQLEAVVNGGEELITQLESEVELDIEEEDQETRELAKVAPAVVAHIDTEIITELRSEGFGYGQIALLVSMSEQSDVPLDDVKELVREHKGMGKVAKELGLHPGNLIKKAKIAADLEAEGTVDEEEENTEESIEEESTTSLETEQELETELSSDVELDNDGLKGKEKAKAVIESKGKGKANGLFKHEEKAKGNGKISVEVKTNIGVGVGIGNGKNDR